MGDRFPSRDSWLVCLWSGHFLRVLAENVLRFFVFTRVLLPASTTAATGWHPAIQALWTLLWLSLLPMLLLAPMLASFAQSRIPWVLPTLTLLASILVGLELVINIPLVWIIAMLAATSGIYGLARQTFYPFVQTQTGWSLAFLRATFTGFSGLGILGGWWTAERFADATWVGYPAPIVLTTLGLLIAGIVLLPLISIAKQPWLRSQSYPASYRNILSIVTERWEGTFILLSLGISVVGLIIATCLVVSTPPNQPTPLLSLWQPGWFALGGIFGCIQSHPYRIRGIIPICFALLVAGSGIALWQADWNGPLVWVSLGALLTGSLSAFQLRLAPQEQSRALTMLLIVGAMVALAIGYLLLGMQGSLTDIRQSLGWTLFILAVLLLVPFGYQFSRQMLETFAEVLIWPMHSIRVDGPGQEAVPLRGPLLVIANHSAWFDPFWLAKVLPRKVTPMMTARFFDLPVISFLVGRVIKAIRVPELSFRREAPELQQAIAALDRGECVILFPQGYLQRTPEQPIRRFGQGIWHILKARPKTPLISCWIEGSWGSYTSYAHGPPTKNKSLDWRRRIQIAMAAPIVVDQEMLEDQVRLRTSLKQQVLETRQVLGLPVIESPVLSKDSGEDT